MNHESALANEIMLKLLPGAILMKHVKMTEETKQIYKLIDAMKAHVS